MSVEENKRVLAEFDELLGADDLTPLDRLCRPDMVNHAIAPDRPAGLAGTREFLETMGRHQMTHEGWLARRTIHGLRRCAWRLQQGVCRHVPVRERPDRGALVRARRPDHASTAGGPAALVGEAVDWHVRPSSDSQFGHPALTPSSDTRLTRVRPRVL
jgi:hypothetical protein